MAQPNYNQRNPGLLSTLWSSFLGFLANIFKKSPTPSLPLPATAKSPTTGQDRVTQDARVNEPNPLKRTSSAASSPISSTARTTPVCRSRSITPKHTLSPKRFTHPPTGPFLNISLSAIFATSPSLALPRLASDMELGLASPPEVHPPGSPSPPRGPSVAASPSLHTLHSRSSTPRTPSSAVIVRLDRSSVSPTTMSDGSLEVISLGDRRGFIGSPVKSTDIGRLPSPWSPVGKVISSDVWLSAQGILSNAAGPVNDSPVQSPEDSTAMWTTARSPWTVSKISSVSLYSTSSALDALGISVFVNLDDPPVSKGNNTEAGNATPKLNEIRDESRPMIVNQGPETPPRKRRETLPSLTGSNAPSLSSRATKYHSTPLTKLDNVGISHVCSASSISSMAYELRLGLFADGRSMSAFENIISLLDQGSPELTTTHNGAMQAVVEVV